MLAVSRRCHGAVIESFVQKTKREVHLAEKNDADVGVGLGDELLDP